MKLSVPQEKVMVIDVQHVLTWSQLSSFFMSASETVRTAFLGQSLMLTRVNYGHASELFKNITIQSVCHVDGDASSLVL